MAEAFGRRHCADNAGWGPVGLSSWWEKMVSCTLYGASPTGTRSARLYIRFVVLAAFLGAVMSSALAQSPVTAHGFSRATLPGIPGDPKGPQGRPVFPPEYY